MKKHIIINTDFSTTDLELTEGTDYISYYKPWDEISLTTEQLREICKEMYERGRLEN